MCEQVLPQFDDISSAEEGADPQLEILKLFAELCTHCGNLEAAEFKIEKVFQTLIVSSVFSTLCLLLNFKKTGITKTIILTCDRLPEFKYIIGAIH